jgi:hypothetical protein
VSRLLCGEPSTGAHGTKRLMSCVFCTLWAWSTSSRETAPYYAVSAVNPFMAYRLDAVCVVSAVSRLGSSWQTSLYTREPDVWLTATKRLTAALPFPVVSDTVSDSEC